jgi:hypothetical protein
VIAISVLADMVERAKALENSGDSTESLRRAFLHGLEFLDGGNAQPGLAGCASAIEATDFVPPSGDSVAVRASLDVLRHRALVLKEQHQRLEPSVDELATECRDLHDRLWALHEQASRSKVALGRRQTVTVRPEPAARIGSGRPGKVRPSRAERLLDSLERQEIELDIPDPLLTRSRALAESHGWGDDWRENAPLITLAHGLAALELEKTDHANSRQERLRADSPALTALRYRVFELSESKRILEIRETALKIDNRGMRIRLGQLEQEVAELDRELAERGHHDRPPSRGLLARVVGRLVRRNQ